jgi:hypothetical protein
MSIIYITPVCACTLLTTSGSPRPRARHGPWRSDVPRLDRFRLIMPTGLNRFNAITDDTLESLHVNMTQVLEYQIPHDEEGTECACAVE